MGRQLVGCLMFLGSATSLFEIAGRLATEQRAGWGGFLFAGLILAGVAVNLWTGEMSDAPGRPGEKPYPANELE
ncbi:MAG: hypothetical protein JWN86_3940 [Planctomycetota bacterium]|nr:hypothetical protein [Planctomycetota bacterium]